MKNIEIKEPKLDKKEYYFYCETCHKIRKITAIEPKRKLIINTDNQTSVLVRDNQLDAYVFCKKCNEYMIDIDEKMVKIIQRLNNKGYATYFCCSGHVYIKDLYNANVVEFGYLTLQLDENSVKIVEEMINNYNNIIGEECLRLEREDEYEFNLGENVYSIRPITDKFYESKKITHETLSEAIKINARFIDICKRISFKLPNKNSKENKNDY